MPRGRPAPLRDRHEWAPCPAWTDQSGTAADLNGHTSSTHPIRTGRFPPCADYQWNGKGAARVVSAPPQGGPHAQRQGSGAPNRPPLDSDGGCRGEARVVWVFAQSTQTTRAHFHYASGGPTTPSHGVNPSLFFSISDIMAGIANRPIAVRDTPGLRVGHVHGTMATDYRTHGADGLTPCLRERASSGMTMMTAHPRGRADGRMRGRTSRK